MEPRPGAAKKGEHYLKTTLRGGGGQLEEERMTTKRRSKVARRGRAMDGGAETPNPEKRKGKKDR